MNAHDPDLLTIDRLSKSFSISSGLFSRPFTLRALQDISFSVRKGETLGIVGESGCGKSTLGRCILQLLSPDEGRVLWLGEDITKLAVIATPNVLANGMMSALKAVTLASPWL